MTVVIEVAPSVAVPTATWTIDVIRATDCEGLLGLFDRCSSETIQNRFFGPVRQFPRRYLADVLSCRPHVHDAVVARYRDGVTLAGMASLAAESEHGDDVAELGVLVSDAWQRQGFGTAMVELLMSRARDRGVARIAASVLPGRSGVLGVLDNRLPARQVHRSRESTTTIYDLI